jgi:hypothetical protein
MNFNEIYANNAIFSAFSGQLQVNCTCSRSDFADFQARLTVHVALLVWRIRSDWYASRASIKCNRIDCKKVVGSVSFFGFSN